MNKTERTARQLSYARSIARDFVYKIAGDEPARFNIEAIVIDLVEMNTTGFSSFYEDMGTVELSQVMGRHEYDEHGVTEAQYEVAMAKAVANPTGWVAMIRYPERADMMDLKLRPELDSPEKVEAHLRDFVNFPDGTLITIFPKIG